MGPESVSGHHKGESHTVQVEWMLMLSSCFPSPHTYIGFQSDDILKKNFKCLLKASILRAKGLPQESSKIERVIGATKHADPYVSIDVKGKYGFDRGTTYVAVSSSLV